MGGCLDLHVRCLPLSRIGRGAGVPPWRAQRALTLDPEKGTFSALRQLAALPRRSLLTDLMFPVTDHIRLFKPKLTHYGTSCSAGDLPSEHPSFFLP